MDKLYSELYKVRVDGNEVKTNFASVCKNITFENFSHNGRLLKQLCITKNLFCENISVK